MRQGDLAQIRWDRYQREGGVPALAQVKAQVSHEKKNPASAFAPVADGRRVLTPEEVALFTGLSVETLAQWRSQKRGIPYLKISRNCVRYRQSDLDAWLQARLVPVQAEP